MRPIYPYDLQDAARALMCVAPESRAGLAAEILVRADTADRYRKRFRRPHPQYGPGTLSGAAHSLPMAEMPWACHRDFLAAMRVLLTVWLDHPTHRDL